MIRLVRDPRELAALLSANAPPELIGPAFDPAQWLEDPRNFALRIDDDLGIGEAQGDWPGDCIVHVYFASRGKQALVNLKAMRDHVFTEFGALRLLGETPSHRKDALLFNRLMGFVPYGKMVKDGVEVVLQECKPPTRTTPLS